MGGFFAGRDVESLSDGKNGNGIQIWHLMLEENEFGHMACHIEKAMTFLYVYRGSMICQVNQEKKEIPAGEGLFINCGQVYRFVQGSAGGCEFDLMMLEAAEGENKELMEQFVRPVALSGDFPFLKLDGSDMYQEQLLEALRKLGETTAEKEAGYELELKSWQYRIWSGLYREFVRISPSQKKAVHRETVKLCKMLEFLHEHYAEKITLAEMAQNSNVSSGEYCRFFKKRMDQTPFEYLQLYRIEQTLPELLNKSDSITQIALHHGFTGSSYYAETFKKEMGCAPGDYRKWYRRETEEECPLSGKSGQQINGRQDMGHRTKEQRNIRIQEAMPAHLL